MAGRNPIVRLLEVQDAEKEFKRFEVLSHDGNHTLALVVNRIDQEAAKRMVSAGDQGAVLSVFDVTFYSEDGEDTRTFADNMLLLEAIEAHAQWLGIQMYPGQST